jgi:hypothetical protein
MFSDACSPVSVRSFRGAPSRRAAARRDVPYIGRGSVPCQHVFSSFLTANFFRRFSSARPGDDGPCRQERGATGSSDCTACRLCSPFRRQCKPLSEGRGFPAFPGRFGRPGDPALQHGRMRAQHAGIPKHAPAANQSCGSLNTQSSALRTRNRGNNGGWAGIIPSAPADAVLRPHSSAVLRPWIWLKGTSRQRRLKGADGHGR